MAKVIDLTGKRFGGLKVVKQSKTRGGGKKKNKVENETNDSNGI